MDFNNLLNMHDKQNINKDQDNLYNRPLKEKVKLCAKIKGKKRKKILKPIIIQKIQIKLNIFINKK